MDRSSLQMPLGPVEPASTAPWWRWTRATAVALLLGAGATTPHLGVAVRAAGEMQSAYQRRVQEAVVVFEVTEAGDAAARTIDQVSILFSNRSFPGSAPPAPLYGDDIVAEFSFSGQDVVNRRLRFTRRVRDLSFLDARFIRVVNHGQDGWNGETLSMSVDGEVILDRVNLLPRQSTPPKEDVGIQRWNRRDWGKRVYWEAELSRFRKVSKK